MRKVVWAMLFAMTVLSRTALAGAGPEAPVPGTVTMVDIGAKACVPCKMMQPVLAAVEEVFKGKAAIVFIDVWEHREQGERFGVRLIPTQIFFDRQGTEVYRHEGFLDQEAMTAKLRQMLGE
jgi:thioredoxin 1